MLLPGSGGLCLFALQIAKALGLTIWSTTSSDTKADRLRDLVAFLAAHHIRSVIDHIFPLERLSDAFRYQQTVVHFGKIVLSF